MRKEAILKMIDTFIRDLKEIRKDVEKFEVSDGAESYTQYTDDELAAFIAKTLEGRRNKLEILDRVANLSNTNRIVRKQEIVNILTFKDFCKLLDSLKYEYSIRPDVTKSKNAGKSIVFKDKYSGTEKIAIAFTPEGFLDSLYFDDKLNIQQYC